MLRQGRKHGQWQLRWRRRSHRREEKKARKEVKKPLAVVAEENGWKLRRRQLREASQPRSEGSCCLFLLSPLTLGGSRKEMAWIHQEAHEQGGGGGRKSSSLRRQLSHLESEVRHTLALLRLRGEPLLAITQRGRGIWTRRRPPFHSIRRAT